MYFIRMRIIIKGGRRGELWKGRGVESNVILALKINMCKQTCDKCVSMGLHPSNIRKIEIGVRVKTKGKINKQHQLSQKAQRKGLDPLSP